MLRVLLDFFWSHPSWVRGLKYHLVLTVPNCPGSHPSWVRGLKLYLVLIKVILVLVAPLVGAWIEMTCILFKFSLD